MAYRIGHLPGSVNIRDDYVEDMLRHGNPFPGGRTIVFICPVGEYSRRLAAFLRQAGHDAASLSGGVVAWRDAGLPLESSLTRPLAYHLGPAGRACGMTTWRRPLACADQITGWPPAITKSAKIP